MPNSIKAVRPACGVFSGVFPARQLGNLWEGRYGPLKPPLAQTPNNVTQLVLLRGAGIQYYLSSPPPAFFCLLCLFPTHKGVPLPTPEGGDSSPGGTAPPPPTFPSILPFVPCGCMPHSPHGMDGAPSPHLAHGGGWWSDLHLTQSGRGHHHGFFPAKKIVRNSDPHF